MKDLIYAINCVELFKLPHAMNKKDYDEMPVTLFLQVSEDGSIKVIKELP